VSGVAVRESLTVAAVPAQVRAARAFVENVLGPGHPFAGDTALLVSELVTNSVRHSGSAVPGGRVTVTVAVMAGGGTVRVAVADQAGDGVPLLLPEGAEGSRGMRLVEAVASRWGYERGDGTATTWFEIQA
jgi:two-component sensor histidine kinase